MTTAQQSDATRLAAVLRALGHDDVRTWSGGCFVGPRTSPSKLTATSKDDLARVVAMLTPEQLVAFDDVLVTLHDEDPKENSGLCHAWAIALSASTWLDALVTAVL